MPRNSPEQKSYCCLILRLMNYWIQLLPLVIPRISLTLNLACRLQTSIWITTAEHTWDIIMWTSGVQNAAHGPQSALLFCNAAGDLISETRKKKTLNSAYFYFTCIRTKILFTYTVHYCQYNILNTSYQNKEKPRLIYEYRVIQNDCRGFNNLSYTTHLR